MTFFSSFFKNFVTSLIVTALFSLVGISLFVGDFPPSVAQVKNVFAEYKKMLRLKEQILDQNKNLDAEQLAVALQNGPQEQMKKLANARNAGAAAAQKVLDDEQPVISAAKEAPVAVAVETKSVDIPKVWQEQFYHLKAEVFRLNQRVAELERQRTPATTKANPRK